MIESDVDPAEQLPSLTGMREQVWDRKNRGQSGNQHQLVEKCIAQPNGEHDPGVSAEESGVRREVIAVTTQPTNRRGLFSQIRSCAFLRQGVELLLNLPAHILGLLPLAFSAVCQPGGEKLVGVAAA